MGSKNKTFRCKNPLQRLLHSPRRHNRILWRNQICPSWLPMPSRSNRFRSNPSRLNRETPQFIQNGPNSVNVLLRPHLYTHEHGSESVV